MVAFDAPTRETCTVRESRTNTPLQALDLLNDVTYRRSLPQAGRARPPNARVEPCPSGLSGPSAWFCRAGRLRRRLAFSAKVTTGDWLPFVPTRIRHASSWPCGQSPRDARLDTAELAAGTTTASLILNLTRRDEGLNSVSDALKKAVRPGRPPGLLEPVLARTGIAGPGVAFG